MTERDALPGCAKDLQAPLELVEWVAKEGRLPVPNFSAGGIATPADAALVMSLGAEAVFVAAEYSSPRTLRRGRRRLSRLLPSSVIRTSFWKPARTSASRCRASTWLNSTKASSSRQEAGSRARP